MLVRTLSSRPWTVAASGLAFFVFSCVVAYTLLSKPSSSLSRTTPSWTWKTSSISQSLLDHVQNATLGFEKIFVINLPSRTDHRDAMSLAAHLTGLQMEYMPGVMDFDRKALPPPQNASLNAGQLGNWRAHMDILRTIVEQNISSALILEDDADWDLRIKSQMRDFAQASQLSVQPLRGSSKSSPSYLDPTVGKAHKTGDEIPKHDLRSVDFSTIQEATSSPYGDIDRWDLLWVGHCGTRFPRPGENMPLMRISVPDETVPEKQHINMQFGNDELLEQYPAHTRVVSRAAENVCTLGYAVSLLGARRMLYEFGVHQLDSATDISIRQMCDGLGRKPRNCLTVQPQLFQHHRAVGPKSAESDISSHGDEYNNKAFTRNIRWSTRLNFEKLLDGETDYIDLFQDGALKADIGF